MSHPSYVAGMCLSPQSRIYNICLMSKQRGPLPSLCSLVTAFRALTLLRLAKMFYFRTFWPHARLMFPHRNRGQQTDTPKKHTSAKPSAPPRRFASSSIALPRLPDIQEPVLAVHSQKSREAITLKTRTSLCPPVLIPFASLCRWCSSSLCFCPLLPRFRYVARSPIIHGDSNRHSFSSL